MAKLKGILRLSGTLDGITFADTKDGIVARAQRAKIPKAVFDTAEQYEEMRKNAGIMGAASTGASRIKAAFAPLGNVTYNKLWTRLMKAVGACIRAGAVDGAGCSIIGDARLLEGFELNKAASLRGTFGGAFSTIASGGIAIPAFNPAELHMPGHATHYRFVAGAVALSAGTEAMERAYAFGEWEAAGSSAGCTLSTALPSAGDGPVVMFLGVQFAQEVNGTFHHLNTHDAVQVVKVEVVPEMAAVNEVPAAVVNEDPTVVKEAHAAVPGVLCTMVCVPDLLPAPSSAVKRLKEQRDPTAMPEINQPARKPGRRGRTQRPAVVCGKGNRSVKKSTGRKAVPRTGAGSRIEQGNKVQKETGGESLRKAGPLVNGATGYGVAPDAWWGPDGFRKCTGSVETVLQKKTNKLLRSAVLVESDSSLRTKAPCGGAGLVASPPGRRFG